MAFDPLQRLEQGNIDFLFKFTCEDFTFIIDRIRNSSNKNTIIKKILPVLKNQLPNFCFEIIYDNETFINDTYYLFHKLYNINNISTESLKKIIKGSTISNLLLSENFELIINKFDNLDFIMEILFKNFNSNVSLLKELSIHQNMHIRSNFMCYLIKYHSDKLNFFYDDIIKYFINYTYQKYEQLTFYNENMNVNDIAKVAITILESNLGYDLYLKIKNYIFNNYDSNPLMKLLLEDKFKWQDNFLEKNINREIKINEFKKDADKYFAKASAGRISIINKYEENISKQLLEKFKSNISFFKKGNNVDTNYYIIDYYNLSKKLEQFVDKYLSISANKTHQYIRSGSTASCYRIGDYVFKLINRKWSCENIICPNLYIILPNLEEELIRDNRNIVCAGIEVQRYLERNVKGIPKEIFNLYEEELASLGYYTTDSLANGITGDNTRLLNDYTESGNPNPPDWFKKYPIVLVDRDRIYENNNKKPKQLRSGNY